ncbi:MAG: hypothetical protein HOQ03_06510 [Thermoleophilia bacterium]|nr:hypothetical protein [Thermoleophilia bacterium]
MSQQDRTYLTLAIVGSLLVLGGIIAAIAILTWRRFGEQLDAAVAHNEAQDARIAELEQLVDDLVHRVDDGEKICDGWHELFSDDRSSVQDLLGRVDALETPAAAPPAEPGPAPMLVDLTRPERPALFDQLAARLPALTEHTGYVPILPVTARVAPIDNTETNFTMETARQVLARHRDVEVVDARELAEVGA